MARLRRKRGPVSMDPVVVGRWWLCTSPGCPWWTDEAGLVVLHLQNEHGMKGRSGRFTRTGLDFSVVDDVDSAAL